MSPRDVSCRNPTITPDESDTYSGGPVVVKWGKIMMVLGASGGVGFSTGPSAPGGFDFTTGILDPTVLQVFGSGAGAGHAVPIGRYNQLAAVLHADGHTGVETPGALLDMRRWIDAADLDGFRIDAVKHMPHNLGFLLRAAVDRVFADSALHFYTVGETFVGLWSEDSANQLADYISVGELSGQFNFPLYWEIIRTIARRESGYEGFGNLDAVVQASEARFTPPAIMGNFLGNHELLTLDGSALTPVVHLGLGMICRFGAVSYGIAYIESHGPVIEVPAEQLI